MSPPPAPPLVVRFGAVGDTVNLTALLQTVAARVGAPCDVVTGRGGQAAVLAGLTSVATVSTLRSRSTPYPLSPEQWRLVGRLRRRPAGPAWMADERDRGKVDWLLGHAGVVPGRQVSALVHPRRPFEHAVEYLLRLAAADPPGWSTAGWAPPPSPVPVPRLAVSAAETAEVRGWLAGHGWSAGQPVVVLQTVARRGIRGRWPEDSWVRTMAGVRAALPDALLVLNGSARERRATAALARAAGGARVIDAAGELPLRWLFALLGLAHSLIGLDSGPGHAAAALGCPVTVLMGRAHPSRNRPWAPPERLAVVSCWPQKEAEVDPEEWWHRHRMEEIPVEAVLDGWRRVALELPAPEVPPALEEATVALGGADPRPGPGPPSADGEGGPR